MLDKGGGFAALEGRDEPFRLVVAVFWSADPDAVAADYYEMGWLEVWMVHVVGIILVCFCLLWESGGVEC